MLMTCDGTGTAAFLPLAVAHLKPAVQLPSYRVHTERKKGRVKQTEYVSGEGAGLLLSEGFESLGL